jgi:hypothetical protein
MVNRTVDKHQGDQNKEKTTDGDLPRKIRDHLRHGVDLKLEFNDVLIELRLMNKVRFLSQSATR